MSFVTASSSAIFIGTGSILARFSIDLNEENPLFKWEDLNKEKVVKSSETGEKKTDLKNADEVVILCMSISNGSSDLLAVGTNDKYIHILRISEDFKRAEHVISAAVPKAPTSCVFDKENTHVIVGDRSGDVHRMSITDGSVTELAGAISMVLAVEMSNKGNLLLMADRDEKLRIARYPQTHVIESFCLGHTEYVRTVTVNEGNVAWTSGGDGTLRKWNILTGECLKVIKIGEENEKVAVRKIVLNNNETKIGAIIDNTAEFLLIDTESGTIEKKLVVSGEALDLVQNGENFVLLTRSEILILNGTEIIARKTLEDEIGKSLESVKDSIDNFYKNVTHNNQQDYEKRKVDKFAKIEEKRLLKRKAQDS